MATAEFDICVIGGGAAGLVVAAGGASLGAKVALVERHPADMGGDCLHYGCIPSKTLLQSAKAAHTMRDAARFGVPPYSGAVHLPNVMRRVAAVIESIQPNDSAERFAGLGVDLAFGEGRFGSPESFEVDGRVITARNFVIATGSRPAVPAIPGLDSVPFLTNETVFRLEEDVPGLIVLGAGPIGCELAQAFCRLGSKVELVDQARQVLPREDADLATVVHARMLREGVRFNLGVSVVRALGRPGDITLQLRDADGAESEVHGTHLLVATGRRLNVERLGLDRAGVKVEKGRLVVDSRLRTTNRRIFAAGDVAGSWQFTHVAEHHAGVVLRNALFHLPARVEARVVPWCTFTDPELARVGLSETDAYTRGLAHEVYRFPFADIDRARADGTVDGMAKILTDRSGRLLGAAIVGPHAGELIHEYAFAMKKRMKAKDLSGFIHVYPTLSMINRRVADQRMKQSLTPALQNIIRRVFRLRGGQ